jgi:hypothetical protein
MYHAIILFHPLNYILTFGFNSVSHTTMASYGVPCRAVLCCGVPSHGMQWHRVAWKVLSWFDKCSRMVLPWYSVASYDVAWLAILCRTMACNGMPCPGRSWRGMVASCNVISCRGRSCCGLVYRDVALCCAMACRAVEVATAASHLLVCLCLVVAGAASGA